MSADELFSKLSALPRDFEENLNDLFTASGNAEYDTIPLIVKRISEELRNAVSSAE